MPTIDRDGVEIFYEAHGSGPAVLLSHGYGATSRMWDGQIAAFADRYRIITWDMRGHGKSGDPADPAAYSHALTVGDMAAVLDACGVERAVIGGLSLGGVMSLGFHIAQPHRVRRWCCATPAPAFAIPMPARRGTSAPWRGRTSSKKGGWTRPAAAARPSSARTARRVASPARRAACWRNSTTA
jgi:pimeloyl-ACP methyl ester carboxylesterase